MTAFDVVIVPDFTGKATVTFAARTLYFLASWLEYSGVVGRWPLHLACIGEPPPAVRRLAHRAGAIISIHDKAALGVYANKLRGFEVAPQTPRILLLDVDILVLSDLSDLAAIVPDEAISAGPSHSAIMGPEMWGELYARLGIAPPSERIPDFHQTLDMATAQELYPSFNSGVIAAPHDSPLLQLWQDHLAVLQNLPNSAERIGQFREGWTAGKPPASMSITDEPALATAVHVLRERGQPFVPLPDRFNGRWRHLYRRSPNLDDLAVFHMTTSFAYGKTLADKLRPTDWGYQKKLLRRYGKRWLEHSGSRVRDAVSYLVPASLELLRLRPILQTLYTRHIGPIAIDR
jgi:hypothetical protein